VGLKFLWEYKVSNLWFRWTLRHRAGGAAA